MAKSGWPAITVNKIFLENIWSREFKIFIVWPFIKFDNPFLKIVFKKENIQIAFVL